MIQIESFGVEARVSGLNARLICSGLQSRGLVSVLSAEIGC